MRFGHAQAQNTHTQKIRENEFQILSSQKIKKVRETEQRIDVYKIGIT